MGMWQFQRAPSLVLTRLGSDTSQVSTAKLNGKTGDKDEADMPIMAGPCITPQTSLPLYDSILNNHPGPAGK